MVVRQTKGRPWFALRGRRAGGFEWGCRIRSLAQHAARAHHQQCGFTGTTAKCHPHAACPLTLQRLARTGISETNPLLVERSVSYRLSRCSGRRFTEPRRNGLMQTIHIYQKTRDEQLDTEIDRGNPDSAGRCAPAPGRNVEKRRHIKGQKVEGMLARNAGYIPTPQLR